jgi:alpha-tubulin suppressor-like RCC1 family protein
VLIMLAAPVVWCAAAGAVTPSAAANYSASYVVKSDGTLWAWGGNSFGELGLGTYVPAAIPVQLGTDTHWQTVAAGSLRVVAIKQDGTLWRWASWEGPDLTVPTQAAGGAWTGPWKAAAVGDNHELFLKQDGSLWAAGSNDSGQLGVPSPGTAVPVQVGSANWKAIAAGYAHSAAVKTDGTLWTWGGNDSGQLGRVADGAHPANAPGQVGSDTHWAAVYAASYVTVAIKTDHSLWAWGDNSMGQLGLGTVGGTHGSPTRVGTASDWKTVAASSTHEAALKTDGTLWTWGINDEGQLGLTPVGYGPFPAPTKVGTATSWAAVACGAYHSLAVTSDDKFAACGANFVGQVGIGYPTYRNSPEQIGSVGGWTTVDAALGHGAGVRADGTLWNWGRNFKGELGPGMGNATAAVQVGTDGDWQSVSCGDYTDGGFTAAIKQSHTLWTWGDNAVGQLGLGDVEGRTEPTRVGTATDWAAVACSDGVGTEGRVLLGEPYTLDDHALALKQDGSLWAWGSNSYGQLGLGLGSTAERHSPVRVGSDNEWATIACGDDYSLAIKTDGGLWAWGHNEFGQLGLGDKVDRNTPIQVAGTDWKAVACGSGRDGSHTLAVKQDGTLWAWGSNVAGELGTGDGVSHDTPTPVGSDADWTAVACGSSWGDNYTLAVKTDGSLWSWGGNNHGQLGNGDYVPHGTPLRMGTAADWAGIACGTNSFALKQDGTLWAWGDNSWGQLGLGDSLAFTSTTVFPLATFTDTVPPTVTATATPARDAASRSGGWSRKPVIVKLTATDAVSGVSRVQYSLSGGVAYLTKGAVKVTRNGVTRVLYRAIDRMGNKGQPLSRTVKIDRLRPKPLALAVVRVKRSRTAALPYKIKDVSPCTVRIVIKNARGVSVRQFTIRGAAAGKALVKSFRCKLAKGAYRWYVYATDSVGYKQLKAGSNKLIVW